MSLQKNGVEVYSVKLGRGSNSWSSIGKTGSTLSKWTRGEIVNCTEFLPFWISWYNGEVKIGKGLTRYENTYMEFTDANYTGIDDVVVKAYGVEGRWYFQIGKYSIHIFYV